MFPFISLFLKPVYWAFVPSKPWSTTVKAIIGSPLLAMECYQVQAKLGTLDAAQYKSGGTCHRRQCEQGFEVGHQPAEVFCKS
jgi:hypothetical protein